jgi:hypothetical protein
MIQKDITVQAPEERSFYTLKYLTSERSNSAVYSNDGKGVTIHFGLCDVYEATAKQIESALYAHEEYRLWYEALPSPTVTRYIIEDGQVILHFQQEGHPELSILVQADHAHFDDKNWEKPLRLYIEEWYEERIRRGE